MMYKKERKEILEVALKLVECNIIKLSAGNLSIINRDKNHIIVTPSGMDYKIMSVKDMVVVDFEKNILDGFRKASVDLDALLYIYKNMEKINSIIHTHQVYATCVGMFEEELPALTSPLANVIGKKVNVCPYAAPGEEEIGKLVVSNIGDSRGIILKNHGVITVGEKIKDALYASVYLEDASKIYCTLKAIGKEFKTLSEDEANSTHKFFNEKYGQKDNKK